jgi:hypothetical protein
MTIVVRQLIAISFCIFLLSCGASIKSIKPNEVRLRDFKKVYLLVETSSGAISLSEAFLDGFSGSVTFEPERATFGGTKSGIELTHALPGQEQVLLAAKDLSFRLIEMGFTMTETQEDADAVAILSIGTVRYDPITGWIADRAYLEFKNAQNGQLLCSFKADTRFITPTVNTILKKLMKGVKKLY